MYKKLASLLFLFVFVTVMYIPGSAAEIDIFKKGAKGVESSLVSISQPETRFYKTIYKMSDLKGNTEYENVRVELLKYNKEKERYEYFENTDGESTWTISGYFWKQLDLERGLNEFRLVAYKALDKEKDRLQIIDFAIVSKEKPSITTPDMNAVLNKLSETDKK